MSSRYRVCLGLSWIDGLRFLMVGDEIGKGLDWQTCAPGKLADAVIPRVSQRIKKARSETLRVPTTWLCRFAIISAEAPYARSKFGRQHFASNLAYVSQTTRDAARSNMRYKV
jgi:hypothetical protein